METVTYLVRIAKNIPDYPECKQDTEEFSHLIEYVEDETDIFVVNNPEDDFYSAREFFYMTDVTKFLVLNEVKT